MWYDGSPRGSAWIKYMKRRQLIMVPAAVLAGRPASAQSRNAPAGNAQESGQDIPPRLLLKDYRPQSIYKVPQTDIKRAKFPIIDAHCHGPRPIEALGEWVKLMDVVGVERAIIFTGANSGERFSEAQRAYSKYPGRFDLWCSFSFGDPDQPDFGAIAAKALEDCHRAGALGVGEIIDKGWGFRRSRTPGSGPGRGAGGATQARTARTPGPHADDARMDVLWHKCAQLGMPVNLPRFGSHLVVPANG
jgi:uncharacterized protein